MAAAAIPALISLAVPLLKPIISSLVLHVESLFGAKTGATKFQSVVDSVTPIINALSTAGILKGTVDGMSVGTLIESIVQDLKGAGMLTPATLPNLNPTGVSGTYKISGTLSVTQ